MCCPPVLQRGNLDVVQIPFGGGGAFALSRGYWRGFGLALAVEAFSVAVFWFIRPGCGLSAWIGHINGRGGASSGRCGKDAFAADALVFNRYLVFAGYSGFVPAGTGGSCTWRCGWETLSFLASSFLLLYCGPCHQRKANCGGRMEFCNGEEPASDTEGEQYCRPVNIDKGDFYVG